MEGLSAPFAPPSTQAHAPYRHLYNSRYRSKGALRLACVPFPTFAERTRYEGERRDDANVALLKGRRGVRSRPVPAGLLRQQCHRVHWH